MIEAAASSAIFALQVLLAIALFSIAALLCVGAIVFCACQFYDLYKVFRP